MVTLTTLPADYDLELYNTNGTKVVTSENANNESEEIIFNTSTVGTYKLRVFGSGGVFNASQCYTLFVTTGSEPFACQKLNPRMWLLPLFTLIQHLES
jgi:hypothetical protein